ncbi:hypothetical protein GCM10025858_08480 [Alicyclobacillus sacchari]|uniref:type I phosphomannose isomerase catalytic subunit n=1 Tax=Alicyclobacillus sacchari TaxID=392010 RepID=UPI0023E94A97|nr:type I phosphomannose isomerase catalytic subunit [Alicyclobacillus sacchari]GMA56345.1 hypothetical protein GCM10025858_08480 [Alicyclobacillus sacchari]
MWPVKFTPVAMPRIWGGHALKSMFGVQVDDPIGEYWVLSGHPNGMSVVADGPFAGRTLAELTKEYPTAYLGHSPQGRFPLLIKYLEAESDLSVQIHPDDEYAREHEGDFGKTEAWYVLDAKPDGTVNYGHTFPDRETYLRAVAEGKVRDYLTYQPIQQGDLVFVPARTLHALLVTPRSSRFSRLPMSRIVCMTGIAWTKTGNLANCTSTRRPTSSYTEGLRSRCRNLKRCRRKQV